MDDDVPVPLAAPAPPRLEPRNAKDRQLFPADICLKLLAAHPDQQRRVVAFHVELGALCVDWLQLVPRTDRAAEEAARAIELAKSPSFIVPGVSFMYRPLVTGGKAVSDRGMVQVLINDGRSLNYEVLNPEWEKFCIMAHRETEKLRDRYSRVFNDPEQSILTDLRASGFINGATAAKVQNLVVVSISFVDMENYDSRYPILHRALIVVKEPLVFQRAAYQLAEGRALSPIRCGEPRGDWSVEISDVVPVNPALDQRRFWIRFQREVGRGSGVPPLIVSHRSNISAETFLLIANEIRAKL